MITERAALRYGRIQARNLQARIGRRRAVTLHGDQPWWWHFVRIGTCGHTERNAQVVRDIARLFLFEASLELFALFIFNLKLKKKFQIAVNFSYNKLFC